MSSDKQERQRHKRSKSVTKGSAFERKVRRLLGSAERKSDGKIAFEEKPKLKLQTGETRFPDFRVTISRSYEKRCITIECQDRQKSAKGILEKISYIQAKHKSKTFIFTYPKTIGPELERSLSLQGVECRNFGEIKDYFEDLLSIPK